MRALDEECIRTYNIVCISTLVLTARYYMKSVSGHTYNC